MSVKTVPPPNNKYAGHEDDSFDQYILMLFIAIYLVNRYSIFLFYYIPINDTSFELSVFWAFDTESRINKLRSSDSISLSFKPRLTWVTCFYGNVT